MNNNSLKASSERREGGCASYHVILFLGQTVDLMNMYDTGHIRVCLGAIEVSTAVFVNIAEISFGNDSATIESVSSASY
jgi:hypothetical protein